MAYSRCKLDVVVNSSGSIKISVSKGQHWKTLLLLNEPSNQEHAIEHGTAKFCFQHIDSECDFKSRFHGRGELQAVAVAAATARYHGSYCQVLGCLKLSNAHISKIQIQNN